MTRDRILITEFMDTDAVETLKARFDVTFQPDLADAQDEIPPRMGSVRALIVRNRTQVTAALLAASPDLVCVGRLGVGLDNIDLKACAARGVEVFPATGANNLSVAEYVIGAAMTLLRGAFGVTDRMLAGDWPRQACSGRELSGKLLGLVGYGAIARDTGRRATALGMEVMAYDPFLPDEHAAWSGVERAELPELLARADVVSLHVPLTHETRRMIGAAELAAMKNDAVLINAARGGVVDEEALARALATGAISGAALDVFETEPLTAAAAAKFQGVGNLILTPHIAGVTEESNSRVSGLIAKRVIAHLKAKRQ